MVKGTKGNPLSAKEIVGSGGKLTAVAGQFAKKEVGDIVEMRFTKYTDSMKRILGEEHEVDTYTGRYTSDMQLSWLKPTEDGKDFYVQISCISLALKENNRDANGSLMCPVSPGETVSQRLNNKGCDHELHGGSIDFKQIKDPVTRKNLLDAKIEQLKFSIKVLKERVKEDPKRDGIDVTKKMIEEDAQQIELAQRYLAELGVETTKGAKTNATANEGGKESR